MTAHEAAPSVDDVRMYSAEALADPHPYWTVLRDDAPVHPVEEGTGFTLISRCADIQEVLRDVDTSAPVA